MEDVTKVRSPRDAQLLLTKLHTFAYRATVVEVEEWLVEHLAGLAPLFSKAQLEALARLDVMNPTASHRLSNTVKDWLSIEAKAAEVAELTLQAGLLEIQPVRKSPRLTRLLPVLAVIGCLACPAHLAGLAALFGLGWHVTDHHEEPWWVVALVVGCLVVPLVEVVFHRRHRCRHDHRGGNS